MIEKGFWASIRRGARGVGTSLVLWKLEDQFRVGLPDVLWRAGPRAGLMELKYHSSWPKRPTTKLWTGVTPNQMAHLREWVVGGGTGYVLVGVDTEWLLLTPMRLSTWERNREGIPGATQAEARAQALLIGKIGKWDPLFRYLAGETVEPVLGKVT